MGADRIKSWPAKERPHERLLAEGPERLTDADLLAIILRIGSGTFKEVVPGTNAYEAALSILRDFRGLRGPGRAHGFFHFTSHDAASLLKNVSRGIPCAPTRSGRALG